MGSQEILAILLNSLMLGMLYILIAMGLTLVYSILEIVNFAHGEFYMLGGFTSYVLFSQLHLNYFLTMLLAFLLIGGFAVIIEKLIFKRYSSRFYLLSWSPWDWFGSSVNPCVSSLEIGINQCR